MSDGAPRIRLAWRLRYGIPLALSLVALVPEVSSPALLAGAAVALVVGVVRPALDRGRIPGVRNPQARPEILDRVVAFRYFVAGCQAITIAVTWELWGRRTSPPLLPAFGLPSPPLHLGPLLLGTLGLALWRPRWGAWAHVALLVAACLLDQTRMQPEVASLAILLVATTAPRAGRTLARAHVATLLLWSGVNKLLSVGFVTGTALYIYDGLPLHIAAVRPIAGWLMAGTEIAVGAALMIRPLRRPAVALSLGLHAMILFVLSPLGHDYNQAVWAWNVALPMAAVIFFWPDRLPWLSDPPLAPPAAGSARVAGIAIAGVAATYPAGFYAGLVDAYLAHNLYSDSTAGEVCVPTPDCGTAYGAAVLSALRVPLPPEPRLFTQYFDATCRPGQQLLIRPRNTRLLFGVNSTPTRLSCPARP